MPNFAAWGGGEGQPLALAELITFKPVSTGTITRGNGTVSAQTVRLETLGTPKQVTGTGGVVHLADAMVLGYKGHPTIADTDLRPGDLFTIEGRQFEVIAVKAGHTDCLQADLKMRV